LAIYLRDKLGMFFATGSFVEPFEYSFVMNATTSKRGRRLAAE
jgi:hypothetical protein